MIAGTIPSSIGSFCNLKYLNMSYNALTGSLPEFLKETKNCSSDGLLPELLYLDLSYNQLKGRLPEWLSQLEILTTLKFHPKLVLEYFSSTTVFKSFFQPVTGSVTKSVKYDPWGIY